MDCSKRGISVKALIPYDLFESPCVMSIVLQITYVCIIHTFYNKQQGRLEKSHRRS